MARATHLARARMPSVAAEATLLLLPATTTLLYGPWLADNVLGKSAVALLLGGVLVLVWAAARVLAGRAVLPCTCLLRPFLAFLAVAAVAAALAHNARLAWEQWLTWALWLALFLAAAELARDLARSRRVVWALLALLALVAAIGLLQVVGIDLVSLPAAYGGTPLSTLGNTNFVAHYLEVVLPLAIAFSLRGGGSARERALAVAAAALGSAHLLLAGSRGGWLGLGVALALMALLARRPRRWGSRLLLAALVAALLSPVATFVLGPIPLRDGGTARDAVHRVAVDAWTQRMTTFDSASFSRTMRLLIWRDSLRVIRAHPWLGVGLGHYGLELPASRTSTGQREWRELMGASSFEAYHAHNELLETWADTGAFGAAAFAWLLAAAVWLCVGSARALGRGDGEARSYAFDRALALGGVGGVAAACTHALFSFNLRDPVAASHLWILCGLVAGVRWRAGIGTRRELVLRLDGVSRRWVALGAAAAIAAVAGYHGLCMLMGDRYYLQGRQELAQQHGNRAVLALREAVAWRGHEFSYSHWLGLVALDMHRYDEAAAALSHSLESHPHNPGAIRLLARALVALGRPAEAVAPLRHALEIDPLTADNYVQLADALRASGKPRAAVDVRRQAFSLLGEPQLLVSLALDYATAGAPDTALAVLEQAARTAPGDGLIAGNLGALQLKFGQVAQAEASLRRALSIDPEHRAEWGGNLARALLAQGRLRSALAAAEAAAAAAREDAKLQQLATAIRQRLEVEPAAGEDGN